MTLRLINTEEQIRSLLPNVIVSAKGEIPMIERIASFLTSAEKWIINCFLGGSESMLNTLLETPVMLHYAQALAVNEALLHALPMLDVVFTPNGLAVVSTQNLTPASTARVERLLKNVESTRDDCIEYLLANLVQLNGWTELPAIVRTFGATLFPDLSVVRSVKQTASSRWELYQSLRPEIFNIEEELADKWMSPELMKVLRAGSLCRQLTPEQSWVVDNVRAQIIGELNGASISLSRMDYIVNYIRRRPDSFSVWHTSETAKLFSPPVFRNIKEDTGYFF